MWVSGVEDLIDVLAGMEPERGRSISSRLLQHKGALCSVPALQDNNDGWVLDAARKANLFAETFSERCQLCAVEQNAYSDIYVSPYRE